MHIIQMAKVDHTSIGQRMTISEAILSILLVQLLKKFTKNGFNRKKLHSVAKTGSSSTKDGLIKSEN